MEVLQPSQVLIKFSDIFHQDIKFNLRDSIIIAPDGFKLFINGFDKPVQLLFDDRTVHVNKPEVRFPVPGNLYFCIKSAIKLQFFILLYADRKK